MWFKFWLITSNFNELDVKREDLFTDFKEINILIILPLGLKLRLLL